MVQWFEFLHHLKLRVLDKMKLCVIKKSPERCRSVSSRVSVLKDETAWAAQCEFFSDIQNGVR